MAAYIGLVREESFEIGELRDTIEYDGDEMLAADSFIDDLDTQVRELLAELESGRHEFIDEDLPFMATIAKVSTHFLPFKYMLEDINKVHRQGLEES